MGLKQVRSCDGLFFNILPLGDYEGPTETMFPQENSTASDGIPAEDCLFFGEPLTHDQRGKARPAGGACDVGAVETF